MHPEMNKLKNYLLRMKKEATVIILFKHPLLKRLVNQRCILHY